MTLCGSINYWKLNYFWFLWFTLGLYSKYTKIVNIYFYRTDWAAAKTMLGDANFLKKLMEYDKDNISEALLKKLKKYIENPKFTPEVVEKVSKVWIDPVTFYIKVNGYICREATTLLSVWLSFQ